MHGIGQHTSGESGSTLVEMMLALMLLMICVSAVSATVTALGQHETTVDSRFSELDRVQVSTEAMSTDIHAAVVPNSTTTAFTTATSTNIVFTAALGATTGPTQVTLLWTATSGTLGTLKVTSVAADASSGPNYTFTGHGSTLVTTDVVNTSQSPLFTFYDDNGILLDPTGTVPGTSLASIASVQFSISVKDKTTPILLTDRVVVMSVAYEGQVP